MLARLHQARHELDLLDRAVFAAVQATSSPTLDATLARLSHGANRSALWVAVAAVMSAFGRRPRQAALTGLAAVSLTSAVVNIGMKRVFRRGRPSREQSVRTHVVRMPGSTSHPSGHAASAFAFSTAVGRAAPHLDVPLRAMAAAVAYSRVHNGVHYPGDVIVGALVGSSVGAVVARVAARRGPARPG